MKIGHDASRGAVEHRGKDHPHRPATAAACPDMSALIPAWVDGVLTPVDKLEVHRLGLRHQAVSVFVMAGPLVLIQQRALGKYHTPGLWANSCCTHPHWGEDARDCARRRLAEELGICGLDMFHCGQVEYRADVGTGLTEHEVVEVFVADTPHDLALHDLVPGLDPAEVMATDWVDIHALAAQTRATPARFTPWLRIYLAKHMGLILRGQGVGQRG